MTSLHNHIILALTFIVVLLCKMLDAERVLQHKTSISHLNKELEVLLAQIMEKDDYLL